MPEETQSRLGRRETWRHRYAKCGDLDFFRPTGFQCPALEQSVGFCGFTISFSPAVSLDSRFWSQLWNG